MNLWGQDGLKGRERIFWRVYLHTKQASYIPPLLLHQSQRVELFFKLLPGTSDKPQCRSIRAQLFEFLLRTTNKQEAADLSMTDWLFGPWELVVCNSKEEQLAKHSLLSIHIESLEIPSVFPYTHRSPFCLTTITCSSCQPGQLLKFLLSRHQKSQRS